MANTLNLDLLKEILRNSLKRHNSLSLALFSPPALKLDVQVCDNYLYHIMDWGCQPGAAVACVAVVSLLLPLLQVIHSTVYCPALSLLN